ncbi:hypothetical protein MPTK1_8g15900 [Marchantia polymorpha subsp. ruderalis]|nr:hypothetical protein Mp_8g15900 [Marchantia polymorpha subsp. ruderalis]
MERESQSGIQSQNRGTSSEIWQTITLRAASWWAWACNNLHPSLLLVIKAVFWSVVFSGLLVCVLVSGSLFVVIYGIFIAPYMFVLFWLVDAVPLRHSTQPEPEQPTFYVEMVQILFVLASVLLYYTLYTLLSLAQKLFPEQIEKLSLENMNELPLLLRIVSGFAFYIVFSVLGAVFTVSLIAVVIFVAYLPYNAFLICDSLGRHVPWYVILGAFVTVVLSIVAVVGYCSDQRSVSVVGPRPARTVDGDELVQMVDV